MEKILKVAVMLSAVDKMSKVIEGASNSSVKSLTRVSKEADRLASSAFNFGRNAGAFGLAMAAPLGLAVKAAAEYEQMNVSLKTAFQGNERAAANAYKMINEFATKTPYELNEVMTGFIKLKNMGLDPSMEALEAYGNTASSMGKSLNDMIEAVADAATGEFERLKEFGIRSKSEGDKVTFTFQGVATTVGKNSKEIEKYLKNIGATKFAGGMEAQSKTFNGQLSTMKDNVKQFAAGIGNILLPILKDLMSKIQPVLEKIQKWTQENPKLTQTIVLGVAAVAALSLAASGLAFVFGGILKVISFGSTIFRGLSMAIGFVGRAFTFLTRIMLTNPILLIITAIAVSVYLIYRNWSSIVAWFKNLWENVKNIFKAVWNWIKKLFWDYSPGVLIYNNWDKIVSYFSNLWTKVKNAFINFFRWFLNIHKRFFDAGVNIVSSLWNGMKSKFNDMIKWFKDGLKELREYLPFSPAKRGPLRDIHRIKLVETIAQNIKPGPMVNAMDKATGAVRGAISKGTGRIGAGGSAGGSTGGSGGGGVVVNFAPNITITGGASASSRQDFIQSLRDFQPELMRAIDQAMARRERTKFA